MKVFVSWSRPRSEAVALALKDWLPLVLQGTSAFVSKEDLYSGSRWFAEISAELEACNFGIICLTPENLERPWVYFEAGALSKNMKQARVVPFVLGLQISQLPEGPLKQFHAEPVDRAGTLNLVRSMNAAAQDLLRPVAELETVFEAMWPKLEKLVTAIPAPTEEKVVARREPAVVLEDLVMTVNALSLSVSELHEKVDAGGASGPGARAHLFAGGGIGGPRRPPPAPESDSFMLHIRTDNDFGKLQRNEPHVLEIRRESAAEDIVMKVAQLAGVPVADYARKWWLDGTDPWEPQKPPRNLEGEDLTALGRSVKRAWELKFYVEEDYQYD